MTLQPHGDDRGLLVALENGTNLPFVPQRVYYIYDTKPGVSRGFHAHRSMQQLVVCVSGSCRLVVESAQGREECVLDSPTKGILLQGLLWRELHDFSPDCVLLVLADEPFNEASYIRDYAAFRKLLELP